MAVVLSTLSLLRHIHLSYTTRDDAFASGLAYVRDDGTVIMQGDNTTWLDKGVPRKRSALAMILLWKPLTSRYKHSSVRISSQAQYNGGLFILDLNKAPWGCGGCCLLVTYL